MGRERKASAIGELELATARYRLGRENGESLHALGQSLLADERYADAAVKLAVLDDLEMAEVGPVFERMCRQVRQAIPPLDEAIRIVSAARLDDIASGSVDPQTGLRRLMDDVYWPHLASREEAEHHRYVGGSYGLERLIGAYWAYDELRNRPHELSTDGRFGEKAISLLDEEVRANAREWLGAHAGRNVGEASPGS
jgi:hypothetical protein